MNGLCESNNLIFFSDESFRLPDSGSEVAEE